MNKRPFQGPLPQDQLWKVEPAWTRPIPRGIPGTAMFGAFFAVTFYACWIKVKHLKNYINPAWREDDTYRLSVYPVIQAEQDLRSILRHEEVKDIERYYAVPRDPNWIVGEKLYYTRYMLPVSFQNRDRI